MHNLNKYYFFSCYNCGEWFYSNRVIKIKKCHKCNRSFQFSKSIKFSKSCTIEVAIATLKQLKINREKEKTLSQKIKPEICIIQKREK
jgi:hypothetical protein